LCSNWIFFFVYIGLSNPIRLVPIFCEYSSIAVETLSITFLFTMDYRIFERNQIPINTKKSQKIWSYKCPTKYGYFFSLLKHYNLKDIDIVKYFGLSLLIFSWIYHGLLLAIFITLWFFST